MTDFYGRPLATPPAPAQPAPRPDRTDLDVQFTVLCGNDNFSTWFYQELMIGRCPL